MAQSYLRYLRYSLISVVLLLFEVSLYDVEAFSCQRVIHKKVGDSVELSSCLPTEGVTLAKWRYGESLIAASDGRTVDERHFKGRLEFNRTSFILTIKELTQQDSGDFVFISDGKTQRPMVTVTLKVHESITHQPDVTGNFTWNPITNSCTVLLECSSKFYSDISYSWTVDCKTSRGSRLQHIIRTQDEETKFTCTIYNPVSNTSRSKTVKCSRDPQDVSPPRPSPVNPLIPINVVGLLLVIITIAVAWYCVQNRGPGCRRVNQSQTVSRDETQQVYSALSHGDDGVYETLGGSETGGPSSECIDVATVSAHH